MKCHNCKFRAVLTTDEPCVDCKYWPVGTEDYFEPAELKVLTAIEIALKFPSGSDTVDVIEYSHDNGRFEMWLEFKKYLDDRKYVGMLEISAPLSLELAVKHLNPKNK